ncbi:MAG: restriction endonuclease subunit S [Ruminococcus sp.]|nr:restriction endonuclease subunit S [Ruminococcus sp.]
MKYYCLSQRYKNWVRSFSTGSTRGNINAQTYADMPIILPPREQQNLLVDILSIIDNKIALNHKINQNLEQQAQAIFDNFFPDILSKNTNTTIGNYITPKRGKNLLSKNAVGGNVPVVAGGLEPATYHNIANTKAPVLTISASGANAGFVNLWNIPVWSSDSSFIDSSMTDYVYFWYIVLKKRQKEIFDAQTGSAQPHIYPKQITIIPIKNISIKEIEEFTNAVKFLFELIGNNKIEN